MVNFVDYKLIRGSLSRVGGGLNMKKMMTNECKKLIRYRWIKVVYEKVQNSQ